LLPGRTAWTADGDLFLTSEQLHLLCAVAGLPTVPGLGPLPIDVEVEAHERLCVDAAARSLAARGILTFDAQPAIDDPDVRAILLDHGRAHVVLALAVTGAGGVERTLWGMRPGALVEWTPVTPTDVRMRRRDPSELRLRIAAVAGIDPDGDETDDAPSVLTREAWEQRDRTSRVLTLDCACRRGSGEQRSALVAVATPDGGWWLVEQVVGDEIELRRLGDAALLRLFVSEVPDRLDELDPLIG